MLTLTSSPNASILLPGAPLLLLGPPLTVWVRPRIPISRSAATTGGTRPPPVVGSTDVGWTKSSLKFFVEAKTTAGYLLAEEQPAQVNSQGGAFSKKRAVTRLWYRLRLVGDEPRGGSDMILPNRGDLPVGRAVPVGEAVPEGGAVPVGEGDGGGTASEGDGGGTVTEGDGGGTVTEGDGGGTATGEDGGGGAVAPPWTGGGAVGPLTVAASRGPCCCSRRSADCVCITVDLCWY